MCYVINKVSYKIWKYMYVIKFVFIINLVLIFNSYVLIIKVIIWIFLRVYNNVMIMFKLGVFFVSCNIYM